MLDIVSSRKDAKTLKVNADLALRLCERKNYFQLTSTKHTVDADLALRSDWVARSGRWPDQ